MGDAPNRREPGRSIPTLVNIHGGPYSSYGATFLSTSSSIKQPPDTR